MARNALGLEAKTVDQATEALEEARQWLSRWLPPRSQKAKLPRLLWPEAALYKAWEEVKEAVGYAGKALRQRTHPAELERIRELLRTAHTSILEAWLTFLYANGMPSGFIPLKQSSIYGSFAISFVVSVALLFVGKFLRAAFFPSETQQNPLIEACVAGAAALIVRAILKRFGVPQRSFRRPVILRKTEVLRRSLAVAGGILLLPGLGMLLWPARAYEAACFALVCLMFLIPYLFQALRVCLFPAEARVLVIPEVYIVFGPRRLARFAQDKLPPR